MTAVAPLPMTATFLPVTSRSSGQNCGWTMRAFEVGLAVPVGAVAFGVIVVAGTGEQEGAGQAALVRLDRPAALGGRPVGADDAVAEADLPVDAELAGGILDIVADGVALSRSTLHLPTAGTGSQGCTCRNPTARLDSGTGPRCRRCGRASRE